MTSTITQETFDEIVKYKWTKDCECDSEREYVICNFYICGKAGTATFRKGYSPTDETRYIFSWKCNKRNSYTFACVRQCIAKENNYFIFTSLETFNKKLNKQYVCPYHSYCPENCPANRITSPEEKCAICLSDVQRHLLEETPCGHHFCLSCLDKYAKAKWRKEEPVTCPTCRRNIEDCFDHACPMYECGCKDDDGDDDDE
jgi:hypothetical protein